MKFYMDVYSDNIWKVPISILENWYFRQIFFKQIPELDNLTMSQPNSMKFCMNVKSDILWTSLLYHFWKIDTMGDFHYQLFLLASWSYFSSHFDEVLFECKHFYYIWKVSSYLNSRKLILYAVVFTGILELDNLAIYQPISMKLCMYMLKVRLWSIFLTSFMELSNLVIFHPTIKCIYVEKFKITIHFRLHV